MDDADTDAMARAMGFSSFGNNKRRKYNHRANEAFVATPSQPLHQPNGANAVPLGTRSRNQDEIALDDDDDENAAGNTPATAVAAPAPAPVTAQGEGLAVAGAGGQDEDPEPQYLDTSHPSLPSADDVQSKIDSILGAGVGSQLPAADAPGSHGMAHRGRGGRQQGGKPWWEDYYDPTANMNPWEKLEKECDMSPTNAWLTWEDSKAKWEEVKTRGIESSAQA